MIEILSIDLKPFYGKINVAYLPFFVWNQGRIIFELAIYMFCEIFRVKLETFYKKNH